MSGAHLTVAALAALAELEAIARDCAGSSTGIHVATIALELAEALDQRQRATELRAMIEAAT